ncbi:flagellar hook protein FlgE [Janthinobacterium psychrotolerans]|uniref:Flagellar hook protein FlgE n=1 Tax=Janthinobacterium psychrotolerans TaxID=1747903 RepID=A0A1A7C5C4_9BURK|nr:flagellar hook-basal body complex protein [Janthinobacterium psychrotolerans]OBV40907.1 flagellar hook protein FlgE [Janthinobacterium psychrotolerans]
MSFDIALSGIQAINEQLTASSNNIANAGTYGFRSSRANFSSMYAGDRATGVEIGSTTQSMSVNGGVLNTGRTLDAAIDGRGYFVSRSAQNTLSYSRVGIFSAASSGFLTDSNGKLVQGYAPAQKGSTTLGPMGDMKIPTGQIAAQATENLSYAANLSAEWSIKDGTKFNKADIQTYNSAKVSVLYDSLGTKHTLSQYFVRTDTSTVQVQYTLDDKPIMDPTATPPKSMISTLVFDTKGRLATVNGVTPNNVLAVEPADWKPAFAPVKMSDPITGSGAATLAFNLNYSDTTLSSGENTTSTNKSDGYASGTYTGVELAADGSIMAKYTNGETKNVGTIALANFADEGALTAADNTSWTASTASGAPLYERPGVGMAGKLATSSLEQSNVDITTELVGLMTSQRNYQANSKVLSTENAMLQSLMQAL